MIDYRKFLNKLNKEEKEFVINLCKELYQHDENAYCELGLYSFELNKEDVGVIYKIKDLELTELGYIKNK